MTDFAPLRDQLLDLRRRTLTLLAERSEDQIDSGWLVMIAGIQATLAAIDEEEGRR